MQNDILFNYVMQLQENEQIDLFEQTAIKKYKLLENSDEILEYKYYVNINNIKWYINMYRFGEHKDNNYNKPVIEIQFIFAYDFDIDTELKFSNIDKTQEIIFNITFFVTISDIQYYSQELINNKIDFTENYKKVWNRIENDMLKKKQKDYLISAPSGSGKTTFIKNHINTEHDIIIVPKTFYKYAKNANIYNTNNIFSASMKIDNTKKYKNIFIDECQESDCMKIYNYIKDNFKFKILYGFGIFPDNVYTDISLSESEKNLCVIKSNAYIKQIFKTPTADNINDFINEKISQSKTLLIVCNNKELCELYYDSLSKINDRYIRYITSNNSGFSNEYASEIDNNKGILIVQKEYIFNINISNLEYILVIGLSITNEKICLQIQGRCERLYNKQRGKVFYLIYKDNYNKSIKYIKNSNINITEI